MALTVGVAGEIVAAGADATGEPVGVAVSEAMESPTLFVTSIAGEVVAAGAGEGSADAVTLPVLLPVAVKRGALTLAANAAGVSVAGREAETTAEGFSSSDITPAVNEAIAITINSVLKINRRFLRLRVGCRYILPVYV